jgi:outer membrane protein
MKTFKLLLISMAIVSMTNLSYGQKAWTLEECINYAIENNIQLKQAEVNARIAKSNYNQSKYNFLPSINGFASHDQNWGKTFSNDKLAYIDEAYYSGNFGISGDIDIFNGLNNIFTLQENKYTFLANQEEVEVEKNNITLQIVLAYLQVLYDQEILDVAENQIQTTRDQVAKTERMVEVGNQAKGSLLEIKAQLAQEKVNVTNAKSQLNLSLLNISQLLNLESANEFVVKKPEGLNIDEINIASSIDGIFETANAIMPEIKSAEYKLKSSELALKKAKWSISPSLRLSTVYYTRYSELANHPTLFDSDPTNDINDYIFSDQIADFAYTQVRISLSIPIFNKMTTHKTIHNAKLNVLNNEYTVELQEQTLYKKIQQAHADASGAYEGYLSNIEAAVSTKESFTYTEQKYNVGLVDIIEYKIAKNNYTKAQGDLLQAKYQYIFKTKILDFYKGEHITL